MISVSSGTCSALLLYYMKWAGCFFDQALCMILGLRTLCLVLLTTQPCYCSLKAVIDNKKTMDLVFQYTLIDRNRPCAAFALRGYRFVGLLYLDSSLCFCFEFEVRILSGTLPVHFPIIFILEAC